MCEKYKIFLSATGDYINLDELKKLRRSRFDNEDSVMDALRGTAMPKNAIWGKVRKTGEIVVFDLSVQFNLETLGIYVASRDFNKPTLEHEAERMIVERWNVLEKKRKKKKRKKALANWH